MSIPPYRFANGETWGEDRPEPRRRDLRGTWVFRLRRARTDPTWASKSPEVQAMLLEVDKRDAAEARRRREGRGR